jgi:lipid-A-disaccharide synthase-like uncharacterized protein
MILGVIGLAFLVIGWIPQTIKVIKDKKSGIDLRFGALYATGSLLLMIYAIQINDYIFMALNALATLMSVISLFYSVKNARSANR